MLLGALDLRLDPWEVEYGSELPAGSPAEATPESAVDVAVERAADDWQPLEPRAGLAAPARLVFVDGVRRIEARVISRVGSVLCHGAFGSYAVGCVEASRHVARLGEARVGRVLALDSGQSLADAVAVGPALHYRPVSSAASDVNEPLKRLQEEMRLAEEQLAREQADRADTLVVCDGPLSFADTLRGGAIGLVKRIHELYVGGALLRSLERLPAGWRSPLFALASPRFARYSWFLRLAATRPGDSELAGLVRLEVADAVGLEAARRLADATAAVLPRFAPSRGRDPRAPQNLLPIGALESQLRRRLGDPRLIRRHIQALLAREAVHA